jgi:hypothetical protein
MVDDYSYKGALLFIRLEIDGGAFLNDPAQGFLALEGVLYCLPLIPEGIPDNSPAKNVNSQGMEMGMAIPWDCS